MTDSKRPTTELTLKEQLVERIKALGIEPKRSMGQNFLIDHYVVSQIMSEVDRVAPRQIVEIGPGMGALTDQIVKRKAKRLLIELDRKVAQYWREQNEEVLEEDALQIDWEKLNLGDPTILVSNLPFQIASRMVIERALGPLAVRDMILMFQKEVAERMTASPRTGDYGFLSIIAQTYWAMHTVVDVSPESFFPAPQVSSRVLRFVRKNVSTEFDQKFLNFVKSAFQFRRKLLTKNLHEIGGSHVRAVLAQMGLRETARPEELSVEQFHQMFRTLVIGAK